MWIVRLSHDGRNVADYGPMASEGDANGFAAFLTAEGNSASAEHVVRTDERALRSPVAELLAFYHQNGGAA